jgi:hypothetical protein
MKYHVKAKTDFQPLLTAQGDSLDKDSIDFPTI